MVTTAGLLTENEFLVNDVSGLGTELRLVAFDQVADALCIFLAMAVASDWVSASGGFDENLRPKHSRGNMHGRNL